MTTSNIVTLENINEVTTKELVAFYNAHNVDAPVAKFADRKTAERRVKALLESLAIIATQGGDVEDATAIVEPKEPAAKVHKTRKPREVVAQFVSPNADIPEEKITEAQALEELRLMREASAAKSTAKSSKTGLSLSAAIAASWVDPEVAAKRMTRNGVTVTVNGKSAEFKSVRTAFAELKLPDAKHIRFRMLVKKEGRAIFEHNGQSYLFVLDAAPAE
jgi:hypothetical protein